MPLVYGDLHIHIGRTSQGSPVKITASPQLKLENILEVARDQKGLQLVGIIDAACSGVTEDLMLLSKQNRLQPLPGGGYQMDGVIVFLGSEVELVHKTGKAAHFLAYFPDLSSLKNYADRLASWVSNPSLSTQRVKAEPHQWLDLVVEWKGVALAAHAFTPHKGVYGSCVRKLAEMFPEPSHLSGLELGLSANSEMALEISDTHHYAYIANSDAHSLGSIGREFTIYNLPQVNFVEWQNALHHQGAGIVATHGLEPLLGKYHRSFCVRCQLLASKQEPMFTCPNCGDQMVAGVWDRILEIGDLSAKGSQRPPYRAHVPLAMLPGVGPKTYKLLLEKLGTEIEILYTVSLEAVAELVGSGLAKQIAALRAGTLPIQPGGGGKYGRVAKS